MKTKQTHLHLTSTCNVIVSVIAHASNEIGLTLCTQKILHKIAVQLVRGGI